MASAEQRQFHIDQHARSGKCPDFTREMVDAVPWPSGNPGAAHANYGMLARDGISCTACHRMVLGKKASDAVAGAPQNACVAERQALLNPDNTGFARTFTGSFLVGAPDTLIGPFDKPVVEPMQNALGINPVHDATIASSEVCGSCHSVHLPVVQAGKVLATDLRAGHLSGMGLQRLPGRQRRPTATCHPARARSPNPARAVTCRPGTPTAAWPRARSPASRRTATSRRSTTAARRDLPVRAGFARHTLVGLNVFLLKMAQQFPDILGIRTRDPMMGSRGLSPLLLTEQAMLDQAGGQTAEIAVSAVTARRRRADTPRSR